MGLFKKIEIFAAEMKIVIFFTAPKQLSNTKTSIFSFKISMKDKIEWLICQSIY